MVLLKKIVDGEFYKHFCNLVVGYRVFAGSKIYNENINHSSAENMFSTFLLDFPQFYGDEHVSHNFHNLLHVGECYNDFGNVMNYSAYDFENYLKSVKQSIKSIFRNNCITILLTKIYCCHHQIIK